MRCPLCHGRRGCPECDGFGEVVCSICQGHGDACAQCHRAGRYVCAPCDGSGACPRCKGEGEIDEIDPSCLDPFAGLPGR